MRNMHETREACAVKIPFVIQKIDKRYVHKARQENVVISSIQRRVDIGENEFECLVAIDESLPFFFEHYIDHLPGLLFVEGARQMGTAVCHMFYHVEFGTAFIIDSMSVHFSSLIELHKPVTLRMSVDFLNGRIASNKRSEFACNVTAIQENRICAEAQSTWKCIPKKLMMRLRSGN
jgi:2-oxo-3-(phosphooxy)propyl 3-oxoalkanoate synthase